MNAQDVLLGAAKIIERNGWCKKTLATGDERCIYGALLDASTPYGQERNGNTIPPRKGGYSEAYSRAVDAVRTVLEMDLDQDKYSLSEWNDAQESAEPVIAVLQKAAKTC